MASRCNYARLETIDSQEARQKTSFRVEPPVKRDIKQPNTDPTEGQVLQNHLCQSGQFNIDIKMNIFS